MNIPSHYVIRCPDCQGRMFICGILCPTCDGNGRLLIPEQTTGYRASAIRALRITFLVALAVLIIFVVAVKR